MYIPYYQDVLALTSWQKVPQLVIAINLIFNFLRQQVICIFRIMKGVGGGGGQGYSDAGVDDKLSFNGGMVLRMAISIAGVTAALQH